MHRLTLICQGATAATRRAAFPLDEPLEEGARIDAAAIGARLRRAEPSCTSPALAARQTAAAIGLDARIDQALRDVDHGRWAGRTLGEIAQAEPEALQAWTADPSAVPHGGESIDALIARVCAWLSDRSGEKGGTIAVTHAAVVRAAVLLVLNAPASSFWRVDVAPLGLVDLRHDGKRWALRI